MNDSISQMVLALACANAADAVEVSMMRYLLIAYTDRDGKGMTEFEQV